MGTQEASTRYDPRSEASRTPEKISAQRPRRLSITPGITSSILLTDALLILVFAALGRASHQAADPVLGVFDTAWPFLLAAALGWLAARLWRVPWQIWPSGVCLWLVTVVGGMAFRILSGKTAEWTFILVATAVLGLFLLGHRLIITLIRRRYSSQDS